MDSAYPKTAGLIGHTANLINQPIAVQRIAGNLVQGFQEMFRDPKILANKKVVVWIINDEPVSYDHPMRSNFPDPFRVPSTPGSIAKP